MYVKLFKLAIRWMICHKGRFFLGCISIATIGILLGMGLSADSGSIARASANAGEITVSVGLPREANYDYEKIIALQQDVKAIELECFSLAQYSVTEIEGIRTVGKLGKFYYAWSSSGNREEMLLTGDFLDSYNLDNLGSFRNLIIENGDENIVVESANISERNIRGDFAYFYVTRDEFIQMREPIAQVEFMFATVNDKMNAVKFFEAKELPLLGEDGLLTENEQLALSLEIISVCMSVLMYVISGLGIYNVVQAELTDNANFFKMLVILGIKKRHIAVFVCFMTIIETFVGALLGMFGLLGVRGALDKMIVQFFGRYEYKFRGGLIITNSDILFVFVISILVGIICGILLTFQEFRNAEKRV